MTWLLPVSFMPIWTYVITSAVPRTDLLDMVRISKLLLAAMVIRLSPMRENRDCIRSAAFGIGFGQVGIANLFEPL